MKTDTQPSWPSNPQATGNSCLWPGLALGCGSLLLVIVGSCLFVYLFFLRIPPSPPPPPSSTGGGYPPIVVPPVLPSPVAYSLTVENGAGSGQYPAGETVAIDAYTPSQDQAFDKWTIVTGGDGGSLFNPKSTTTRFTMPRRAATVRAIYKLIEHRLTVQGGSGSGAFPAGTMVSLSADSPRRDQVFVNWATENGGSFLADTSPKTTFVMPRNPATVTANFVTVDSFFSGKYASESGKTMYEIDSDKRRFSFSILIEGRFRVQTEILPYDVLRFEKLEEGGIRAIEISGEDKQTVSSAAALRLTRISGNVFKLERIKPLGGDLGVFKRHP